MAVDAAPYWEPLTGVGWYLDRVLRALARRQDVRLRLYGENLISTPGSRPSVQPLPDGPAIEIVRYTIPEDLVLPSRWLTPIFERLRPLLIAADRNQIVFAPNFYPARRFEPTIEMGSSNLVATVHDLAFRRAPWSVESATLDLLSRRLPRTLGKASLVLVPSRAVRAEILSADLAAPNRVVAIHHGPGQLAIATSWNLPAWAPPRYGLFVGTVEPRKNLDTLLSAWRLLRKHNPLAPSLVVCGKLGWKSEALRADISAAAAEGWLHHPGYVGHEDLAALVRGAALLAFPSYYEGFGLPVLEALAAGTPVVASDIPVLREVADDAALFAPTRSAEVWERQLALIFDDPELASSLSEAGRNRAAAFSWQESAEAHVQAFRRAAAER